MSSDQSESLNEITSTTSSFPMSVDDDSPAAFSVLLGTSHDSKFENSAGSISILIIDDEGRSTDRTVLRFSHSHTFPFLRGHTDLFVISHQPSLGNLESVSIYTNGAEESSWKIFSCCVFHHEQGKVYNFTLDEKSSSKRAFYLLAKEEPVQIMPLKLEDPLK